MSSKKNISSPPATDVSGGNIFLCRELSWLNFNERVLDEAGCKANPLLDRMKFIAICSGNLDEFFMVRIAGLHQLVELGDTTPDPSGLRPGEQLAILHSKIRKLLTRQYGLLNKEILPALEEKGYRLSAPEKLSQEKREELEAFYLREIQPVLTPIAVDPSHPFPQLSNGALEIALSFIPSGSADIVHAFVEVPEVLPRFIEVKDNKAARRSFILLEDLIMANLPSLFSGCRILEYFPCRVTRDMNFIMEEDGIDDLLHSMERNLVERRRRDPIRLEKPHTGRSELAEWLQKELHIENDLVYEIPGILNLKQLFELVGKINRPDLQEEPWPSFLPPAFEGARNYFDAIRDNAPILLALPFHKFDPVIRLLEEAADDPAVLAIKQTLYRVSGNSPVVRALQRAAENGKQVTVIVELKARFDESNNIIWARRLEESGAHVVYGISGLKIHCKALLIVRREEGMIRRYLHLATGNYNDKTATMYTDLGIFSCDSTLAREVANLFNVMTAYSAPANDWRKIAVAPFDLRTRFLNLIDREARLSTPENPGHIIAKMNGLVDSEIIEHLYAAAKRGTKIELIVRGICCLKPGVGTENIRVISIVDRYLEHSRIFYFRNGGAPEYYLASADWMVRNLDRRIELLFPVEDPAICKILGDLLQMQLNDREKGRRLLANGAYTRSLPDTHTPERSQHNTYLYLKNIAETARRMKLKNELPVFTGEHFNEEE